MKETSQASLVAALFGILFLATVDNSLLIPLLPMVSRDLDASMESLGWFFSSYALAAALFNLGLGPLTDRWGRVPFLRIGLAGFAVVSAAAYLSQSYGQLLAARTAAGFAGGLISTCVASLVGDFFPYARRGRVMGAVLSAYFAALILGVPLGVQAANLWGWRSVFLGSGALAAVLTVYAFFGFPREAGRRASDPAAAFRAYLKFVKRRDTLGGLICSFAVSGATLSFLTYISGLGLTPTQVAQLLLISGVAAMAGSPLSGWLSDRFSKRGVFLLSNTLLALPLFFLSKVPWGWALASVFFGASLLVAARQTALQTIQTQLIPTQRRGAFIGLRNGFSQLGISASVFAAGKLFTAHGYAGVTVFAALLTLAASGVFFLAVDEPVAGEAPVEPSDEKEAGV